MPSGWRPHACSGARGPAFRSSASRWVLVIDPRVAGALRSTPSRRALPGLPRRVLRVGLPHDVSAATAARGRAGLAAAAGAASFQGALRTLRAAPRVRGCAGCRSARRPRAGAAQCRRRDHLAALAPDPLHAAGDRLRGGTRARAPARDESTAAHSGTWCDRSFQTTSARAARSTTSRCPCSIDRAMSRTRPCVRARGRTRRRDLPGKQGWLGVRVACTPRLTLSLRDGGVVQGRMARLGAHRTAAGSFASAAVFTSRSRCNDGARETGRIAVVTLAT